MARAPCSAGVSALSGLFHSIMTIYIPGYMYVLYVHVQYYRIYNIFLIILFCLFDLARTVQYLLFREAVVSWF